MNGERSKYVQVVQHVHKNISTYVPFLLMMKIDFTENFGFFFLSYFFRFIGVLILCGDFSFTKTKSSGKRLYPNGSEISPPLN